MSDRFDADTEALLRFYADAGYVDALDDEPHDRFAETAAMMRERGVAPAQPQQNEPRPTAQAPVAAPARPAPPAPVIPAEGQAERARELARSATSLEGLREILDGFDGCNLRFTAKQLVFADGNPQAEIMFVGEAPGREEDLEGRPFVGRSGQLLDRMMAAIGLSRDNAYIANVVPWRPPGNRDPSPLETEICRPFIERQIELVAPKVLVTLGGPSSKVMLDSKDGIMRMRGNWKVHRTVGGLEIPAMPTLHPAYLLRNPPHKKLVWRDLLDVKMRLRAG